MYYEDRYKMKILFSILKVKNSNSKWKTTTKLDIKLHENECVEKQKMVIEVTTTKDNTENM